MAVYLLTGSPKAGKTTLLYNIVKALKGKKKVGGFLSPERKEHGTRTAFYVEDVSSGEKALLASIKGNGPRVGKYFVDVVSFEDLALPILEKCEEYDVLVIDEIGAMEMKSKKFSEKIEEILRSKPCTILASVGIRYIEKFKTFGEVIRVNAENRHLVEKEILEKIKEEGKVVRKKKVSKKKNRKSLKKERKVSKAKSKKKTSKRKKVEEKKGKAEKKTIVYK